MRYTRRSTSSRRSSWRATRCWDRGGVCCGAIARSPGARGSTAVCRLHSRGATAVLRDPACHVPKGRQLALVAKAAVDRQRVPVAKVLDDSLRHPPSRKCASSTCCANGLTLTVWTNTALGRQAAIGRLAEQPKHEATPVQPERSAIQGDSYAEPVSPLGPSAAEPHEQQPNEDDAGPGREDERYRRTPASVPRRAQQDCQILRLAKRGQCRPCGGKVKGRRHHPAQLAYNCARWAAGAGG